MTRKQADRNLLFLTGPKHAGKTSAGRELALRAGGVFIDLDELAEEMTGKNPRALYQEGGPARFQEAEYAALQDAVRRAAPGLTVVAAGGGISDNPGAMAFLTSAGGRIVCLEVSAATAWERIRAGGTLPPFLATPCPVETHRRLHERRSAAYRKAAHIIIHAEGRDPEWISREIAARLCILPDAP
ncbi:MAG: AAA family ATPase [Spirochaetaceae bacterium]|jgi:shikimate kinase|nr:AAA family ATPase [Spirochaetaceae bacterium]